MLILPSALNFTLYIHLELITLQLEGKVANVKEYLSQEHPTHHPWHEPGDQLS